MVHLILWPVPTSARGPPRRDGGWRRPGSEKYEHVASASLHESGEAKCFRRAKWLFHARGWQQDCVRALDPRRPRCGHTPTPSGHLGAADRGSAFQGVPTHSGAGSTRSGACSAVGGQAALSRPPSCDGRPGRGQHGRGKCHRPLTALVSPSLQPTASQCPCPWRVSRIRRGFSG